MIYTRLQDNINVLDLNFQTSSNVLVETTDFKERTNADYVLNYNYITKRELFIDNNYQVIINKNINLTMQDNIVIQLAISNLTIDSYNNIDLKVSIDGQEFITNSIISASRIVYNVLIQDVLVGNHNIIVSIRSNKNTVIHSTQLVLSLFAKKFKLTSNSSSDGMTVDEVLAVISDGSNTQINTAVENKAVDLINSSTSPSTVQTAVENKAVSLIDAGTSTTINSKIDEKVLSQITDNYINYNLVAISSDLVLDVDLTNLLDNTVTNVETENLIMV
jgi:hypothetical protein